MMRHWMDVCEQLTESIEQVTVRGRPITVLHNPTERALLATVRKHNMRGFVDGHSLDTYWWDAFGAIHEEVARELGLDPYMGARLILKGKQLPAELSIQVGIDTALKSPSLRYLTAQDNILVSTPGQMMPGAVPFGKFLTYWSHNYR